MIRTGDVYFDSEEFRNILSTFEESFNAGHPAFIDADDLADIADYYHINGYDDKASEVIEYALSVYPNATQPNVFKARQALTDGDIDLAKECIEQIESKDDPDYHYMQAELLIAQEREDEADAYLRDYFMTVPPEEYEDFIMDVANIYFAYELNDKAYEWLMRSKGNDSNAFKELMGHALFGIRNYKECKRIFTELLDEDPYSTQYWNSLANAQFLDKDYMGALTSCDFSLAINPEDTDALMTKANVLYQTGNYEEAIRYFNRYDTINHPDELCLLHKGSCLVNLNRYEEAIEVFKQLLTLSDIDTTLLLEIYQELALCYSALQQKDEAIRYIDKATDLNCDPFEIQVLKGHVYLENDCIDEAEKVFRNAIKRSQNDPLTILRIIISLYENRYVRAAYDLFQKFFSMFPTKDHKLAYSYMALCCWDLGFTEDFLYYLRMAVENNPQEARLVLGRLFPEELAAKDYYSYIYHKLKQ
ncbi:MAG: tetratricopeptide repeat protein [Prevotella sp.]|nr:tetratricopeptide repeat protein [Prevotella sp.]